MTLTVSNLFIVPNDSNSTLFPQRMLVAVDKYTNLLGFNSDKLSSGYNSCAFSNKDIILLF